MIEDVIDIDTEISDNELARIKALRTLVAIRRICGQASIPTPDDYDEMVNIILEFARWYSGEPSEEIARIE